jgi:hypothetical protein
MKLPAQPVFLTVAGLARFAAVNASVVRRLWAQGTLPPAAMLDAGKQQQPLFDPTQAKIVIRNLQKPRGRSQ